MERRQSEIGTRATQRLFLPALKNLILGTLLTSCALCSETLVAKTSQEPEYDGLLEMSLCSETAITERSITERLYFVKAI